MSKHALQLEAFPLAVLYKVQIRCPVCSCLFELIPRLLMDHPVYHCPHGHPLPEEANAALDRLALTLLECEKADSRMARAHGELRKHVNADIINSDDLQG